MAVSRLPAPPRSRPASVDARAVERETRAAAARKEGQAQADSFWCGCMSRPSAVSPPPLQKRSSGKNTTDGKSSKSGAGESRDNSSSGDKLEFRSSDTVLKSTDHFRSTDTTRIAADGKPLELKGAGDSYIHKKFTTLAEGLELRPTSPFRPRLSPGKVSPLIEQLAAESAGNSPPMAMPQPSFSTYSKANGCTSTIGSSPPVDRTKSSPSPTLFEMMAHEQELQQQQQPPPKPLLMHCTPLQLTAAATTMPGPQPSMQEKVSGILGGSSPGNQFNDAASSDLKLTLSSKDGYSVTVCVHRQVMVANSRFFAAKLSDRWSKQQRTFPHLVEIADCEDVELYLETLRLMYCCDMKRTLMKETVVRVLGMLKVSAAIVFEAGVVSCLEFLEAVPWAEDEEEKITSLLSQLQLESVGANEVLKRCSAVEVTNSEDILVRLLNSVTKGTDEKARREMKALVSRMLRENVSQNKEHFDVSKESLYKACHNCVDSLLHLFMQATSSDFATRNSEDRGCLIAQIARQADNLHWLVDILIDRRIADELVRLWAHQSELATLHMQVPTMYRYEVSRLTARFCIAIGKGQVVVPKDVRYLLLQTWLQPLVEDFGWMQRCCKVLDKKVVEEGISQTILTLPLKQQQTILLAWFDRFSNSGDDCPNLQRAFEVWWRRMFLRPHDEEGSHADPHAN